MRRKLNISLLDEDFKFCEYKIYTSKKESFEKIGLSVFFAVICLSIQGNLFLRLSCSVLIFFYIIYNIYTVLTNLPKIIVNENYIKIKKTKIIWNDINEIEIEIRDSDLHEVLIYYFYTNNKIMVELPSDLDLSSLEIEKIVTNYYCRKESLTIQ